MAWGNVPQTPTYQDKWSPASKVNPQLYGQPMAQQNTYGSNRYQDPGFGKAASGADAWGTRLLGQGSGMASDMQGYLRDPSSLISAWGAEGWSPGHRDMAPGMAELRGGTRNMLDAGVRSMAGAGVTAGRGGFGVTGGAGPEATAQQALIRQLASQYGNDYMGIAGLINDSARNRGSLMGSALGAGASMTGSLLNAGTAQGNLALGNRTALQGGQQDWLRGMADENRWNATNYNTAMSQAQAQERQRQQQYQGQQTQQDQEMQRWNAFNAMNNAPDAGGRLQHYRNLNQAYSPWGWAKAPDVQIQARAGF